VNGFASFVWTWIKRVSIDQWRAIDRETVRSPEATGTTSLTILAILITVCISLTLQEYVGGHDTYNRLFPNDRSRYWELWGFVWWSGWRVIGYVLLPMLVIVLLPGEHLRDYNISFRGFFKHLWIYAVLYLLVKRLETPEAKLRYETLMLVIRALGVRLHAELAEGHT